MNARRSLSAIALAVTVASMPLYAHAAIDSINKVIAKACMVTNWLFTGAVILTIVFVLLAAITYITKGSNPTEVSKAHQMLLWAAIGFAVALVAAVVPQFLARLLETQIGNVC